MSVWFNASKDVLYYLILLEDFFLILINVYHAYLKFLEANKSPFLWFFIFLYHAFHWTQNKLFYFSNFNWKNVPWALPIAFVIIIIEVFFSGIESLLYDAELNTLRLVEAKRFNVSWYVYTHESRMVLLASGMQCTTFYGFQVFILK